MPPRTIGPDALETLGKNLKEKRGARSIADVLERTGLTRPRLSLWENGRETPGIEGLLLLANDYGCSIDDFLSGVDGGYDSIIERRVPIDAKLHYESRISRLEKAYGAAMRLLAEADREPSPHPAQIGDARPKVSGKSAKARARRKQKKPPK